MKDWFTLSSRERTGMKVLLVLNLIVLILNLFLRYYPVQQKSTDNAAYQQELERFRNSLRSHGTLPEDSEAQDGGSLKQFPFDPNTATKKEMVSLGMEERIAARIISYREKGGRFRKKEDLLKVYGFDRILYASLTPYIIIPKPEIIIPKLESRVQKPAQPAEESIRELRVELNSSDTSVLMELRGIGPVLASRIIKYRGLLGGYYSVDQLKEVYGISDSLFQAIKNNVLVEPALVKRIPVNQAGEAQLSRHPYIGRYKARAIVTYRKTAGCILSTEELVRNKILLEEEESRMNAYLSFQMQNPEPGTGNRDKK